MNIVIKCLERIENYNEEYTKIATRLKECYYEIQEASRDISSLNSGMEFDEEEQSKVEERLDLISSLKRKYGNDIKEILDYKERVNSEIYEINNLEGYLISLKTKFKNLEEQMLEL